MLQPDPGGGRSLTKQDFVSRTELVIRGSRFVASKHVRLAPGHGSPRHDPSGGRLSAGVFPIERLAWAGIREPMGKS